MRKRAWKGPRTQREIEETFWSRVDKRGKRECWRWMGGFFSKGYGAFAVYRQNVRAHRFSYKLTFGKVPDLLDHDCNNKWCVNPWHLKPSTSRMNVLRADGPSARNARKKMCRHGHKFTKSNTYTYRRRVRSSWKYRVCKKCVLNRMRRYRREERQWTRRRS